MRATTQKHIIPFLACLLLLLVLSSPVMAHGGCGPCADMIGGHCVCVSECCFDSDCGSPFCWICIKCGCKFLCDTDDCEDCIAGSCDTTCDADDCESCVNGDCLVCGGNPNQKCCDGSCCNKTWRTDTTDPITTNCPSCGSEGICGGTTTELESYVHCVSASGGQGTLCECQDSLQTVGYTYPCMANWDVSQLSWCALMTGLCAIQCVGSYADPASCADCLVNTQADCCGDECEICDFVEECKKNAYSSNIEEQKSLVFTGGC
ncbi:MAG: hypothetical protein JW837_07025 [Sedimentisphaerales bacterium]|nr:hypothetical protein [Sedimentisphaerales bacterium]